MFNQFFLHSTRDRLCCTVILFMAFSCFGLTPSVKAQEAANDPVYSVEAGSASVWRDGVTTGSITVVCTDINGKPVANAPVSVSIPSPGTIVSPSNGSGTTGSDGTITVTVKSTDFTAEGQDKVVDLTATSEGVSGIGIVNFRGPLQILNNSTDVTGKTTACKVGEQQSLSASTLSGVTINSAHWAANGATPIGGWNGASSPVSTTTTAFPPDSNSEPTTVLYLTTTGNDTTTLTATDTNATGTTTTNFTVSRPNDFSFTAVQQVAHATPQNAPGTVGVGDLGNSINIPGIQFNGSGGSGGTLTAAQIISTNSWTYTLGSGSPTPGKTGGVAPGLDSSFPYSIVTQGSPDDSPRRTAIGNNVTNINVPNWSATMYLMWTSNKSNSIPIPVESFFWTWNANANYDPNTGKLVSFSGSSAVPSKQGTPYTAGVLNWSNKVTGS